MFRVVLLSFSLIFVTVSGAAQAQETVRLRAGEHKEYARVVFDWGKRVNYTVTTAEKQLIIKFSEAAKLDDSPFRADKPKNIPDVKVLSTNPLEVALTIVPGAEARNFSSETKVVVDVYDPPKKSEKRAGASEKGSDKKAEKATQPQEPKKIASAPVETVVKQTIPPKPTQPVKAPSAEDLKKLQSEAVTELKPAGPPAPVKPDIIQLTATKSTGLAVYERAGKIWLISDQEELMLSPNVTGPNAKDMMPPGGIMIEGGKAYTFPKISGKSIQGQGGGLVWRIVVAPQDIYLNSIKPRREDENGSEPGGGKLVWEMVEPGRVLNVPDPVSGKMLKVVTVNSAKYLSGPTLNFIEFETLHTPVGLVILPKVDDLTVEIARQNVVVSRPGGLHLMPQKNVDAAISFREAKTKDPTEKKIPVKRIFDFNSWQMGGLHVLERNRNHILSTLGGKPTAGKIEGLLSLARMHLANGLWAEASGFLDFALQEMPELDQNPEFIALDGATKALGRVSDIAFQELNRKELESYPEIGYWKAFVLAHLEDWQQAGEVLPASVEILSYYPEILLSRLGLLLSEVALRSGKLEEGEKILKLVEEQGGDLVFQQKAALEYLKGEAARQRGKPEDAIKYWKPLTTGKDAMYRARAGLAITRLQYEKKQITPQQAIDNLERLRYAWRGDELEALINYWLGKVYFDTKDYIKGLNIMRDAAIFSEGTDLGERIASEMVDIFTALFTGDELKKISGPDAAALYDEFRAYIPEGEKGNLVAEKLADRLVDAELLDRAIMLLQAQMQKRDGIDAYRIATKLAAIELLDNKPANASSTLSKAKSILDKLPEELRTPERYQEISLLRARALSQQGRPDQALALLKDLPRSKDVNHLRADIAWRANYWDDAAEALGDVINDEEISLTRPLSPEHAGLLMQRAVALSLASDRIGLANMREKYTDAMAQTDKARVFEVITRPRQSSALADRKTLMSIVSEVDLFKEFLNSYKQQQAAPVSEKPAASAPGTPTEAGPATTPPATN